jgi:hypothetical protein
MPSAQASRTFRYKSTVKILPPSLPPERVKVDDFYAAHSRLIPPLPWPTFSPPFSPGRHDFWDKPAISSSDAEVVPLSFPLKT